MWNILFRVRRSEKMISEKPREKTRLWRNPNMDGVVMLHATYVNHSFARHSHEGYAVGIIESGGLGFNYRGENLVAPRGSVNLAVPGEAHTGHGVDKEGWAYRMFYLEPSVLRRAATQMAGKRRGLPFFSAGVAHDGPLGACVRHLHLKMEEGGVSTLERESLLLWMLTRLILRHGESRVERTYSGREHPSVKRVREYIEDCCDEDISLSRLSAVANLSAYHLIRVFTRETGLQPHKYLTQARVNKARELLSGELPIAAVALETGFVDQSHFTRQFKRITGVTPGQYRKFLNG